MAAVHSPYRSSGSRLIGVALVVLLHLGLAYALVNALARRAVTVAPMIVETEIVAETPPQPTVTVPPPVAPPAPAEPAPPAKIAAPPPRPPVPHHSEVRVEPRPPPPSADPTPVPVAPPVPLPAAPVPVPVMPHLDLARSHEPEYPVQSRQLGEQGSVVLQVLVGTDGDVLDTRLVQSSGFDRLDQAALREIKASYRFVPGTIDGKPQPMWYAIKYNWKLR